MSKQKATSISRAALLLVVAFAGAAAVATIGDGPPSVMKLAADENAPGPVADAPTEAEIQEELRRAESALGGRSDATEELPVNPLRADVAIALPSDI